MKSLTICMYGAASDNISSVFIEKVELLGEEIALRGHSLIYGGGASGLMGACARGVRKKGGKVLGVVPMFMENFEPVFEDATYMIKTKTMSERKQIMENNADAFVIAPGGIGTFDELFQVLTLAELGRTDAPIILYNVDGYYDRLIGVIQDGIQKGFIRQKVSKLFTISETPENVLDQIEDVLKEKVTE